MGLARAPSCYILLALIHSQLLSIVLSRVVSLKLTLRHPLLLASRLFLVCPLQHCWISLTPQTASCIYYRCIVPFGSGRACVLHCLILGCCPERTCSVYGTVCSASKWWAETACCRWWGYPDDCCAAGGGAIIRILHKFNAVASLSYQSTQGSFSIL